MAIKNTKCPSEELVGMERTFKSGSTLAVEESEVLGDADAAVPTGVGEALVGVQQLLLLVLHVAAAPGVVTLQIQHP